MEKDCGFQKSKMGDGKSKVESQDLDFQKLNLKKRSDFDKAKPRKCTALCVFCEWQRQVLGVPLGTWGCNLQMCFPTKIGELGITHPSRNDPKIYCYSGFPFGQ